MIIALIFLKSLLFIHYFCMQYNLKRFMKSKGATIGQYISGKILANEEFIRRLPVLAYVGLLMMLYMANNFSVQAKYDRMNKLSAEIKTLRTISVTTSEQRMVRSRQSEVEKMLLKFNIPLVRNTELPTVIQ